jgi:Kef-type K+ transport system membrane component KefB
LKNPAYVCFIWFGLTAGVSLLATPVKFTAPLITRPVALDVGRVVFSALNKAELIALIVLLIVVRISGKARELWMQCSVLLLILLAQSVWLLPQLAERSQQIIAGIEPAPSMLHGTYSILELLKLSLLLYLGFRSLRSTQDHFG